MAEQKNHPEIKHHLVKIRKGITEHEGISGKAKEKALAKLDIVQSHVDENKVSESTTQHLRDMIHHLEENPTLIGLVMEAMPYLPH